MASFFGSESDVSVEAQGSPCVDRRFFESTGDKKNEPSKREDKVTIVTDKSFEKIQTSKSEKINKTKRKSSSLQASKSVKTEVFTQKSISFRDSHLYTARELMTPLNSTRKIKLNQTLQNLPPVKDPKEFNKQIGKKLTQNFKNSVSIQSSDQLEAEASLFFEKEISNETKNIATISNKDLVSSEPYRAKIALTKIQKSAFLISELINRLIEMKSFILSYLKEVNKTTDWCKDFFLNLSTIISSYKKKEKEMNPLKTFLFSFEKLDTKMKKVTNKCFKIEEKELIKILNVFKKWSDSKTLEDLRSKVRAIDHKRTLDLLNFSTEDLSKQMHEWFESEESENFLLNATAPEILDALRPIQFFLNNKKIDFLEKDQFLITLLKEIYAFSEEEVSLQTCQNQVHCLTSLETILDSLKTDLSSKTIPWVDIQQKLQPFTAIPFFKFKKIFNPSIHLKHLGNLLLGLAIPAFDLLKMGSKKSWQKADECLQCLFTDLFTNLSYQINPTDDSELVSHFQIENNSFFVLQTKEYKIYSSALIEKPVYYATATFMWTISPCLEGLKGCLQISNIQFSKEIKENQKQAILKILNNPNIIDYVDNALKGKPKIISVSL